MKTTSTAPVLLFFTKDDGETPSPLPSALASVTMVRRSRNRKAAYVLRTGGVVQEAIRRCSNRADIYYTDL